MKGALQHSRLLYRAANSLLRREAVAAAAGPWFTLLAGPDLQPHDSRCAVQLVVPAWRAHHAAQSAGHQGFSNWAAQVAHDSQPPMPSTGQHRQKQVKAAVSASSNGASHMHQHGSAQQRQRPIPVVPPPSTPALGSGREGASSSSRSSSRSKISHRDHQGSRDGGLQRSKTTSKGGGSKNGNTAALKQRGKHTPAAQQQQQLSKPSLPILFAECKTAQQLLQHLPSKLTAMQARSALQQLVYIIKGERLHAAAAASQGMQGEAAIAGGPAGANTEVPSLVTESSSMRSSSISSTQAAGREVVRACSACLERAQPMTAADAALVAYTAVKVGQPDQGLLPALEAAVMARGAALSPLDTSRLAVACSLGDPSWASPVLLTAVTTACARHLRAMAPAVLVSTLRHLTLAGAKFPELMEAAADRLLPGVPRLDPLAATKVLWLCAKQGVHDQALLDAVAAKIVEGLHQLSPSVLNNVAWACSRLQYHDGRLCLELTQRLQQQLRGGVPRGARPGVDDSEGPATPADSSSSSTVGAAIEQGAATLYHISLLRPNAPGLLDAAADHVVAHSSSYTPAALQALTWSLAMSHHPRPDALEAASQQALALLPQMKPDEVAKLVVALCAAKAPGPAAGAFFTAAMPCLQQQAGQLSQLQLVEAVRALSVWPIAARMQGAGEGAGRRCIKDSSSSSSSSSSSRDGSYRTTTDHAHAHEPGTVSPAAAAAAAAALHRGSQEEHQCHGSSSLENETLIPPGQNRTRFEVLRSLAEDAISSRRQLTKEQAINVYHALRRTHQQQLQERLAALVLQLGGTQSDLLGSKQEADSWQQRFAGE